ncbi:BTB/POZ domain-containing protein At4g08455-like [Euphorbia lathyris]|uniref:BTB/POZ domain-containing protein At4g08455-like n=1 Tax=Euphorbia lathyris TaxID=212925 RepID=UPI003313651C
MRGRHRYEPAHNEIDTETESESEKIRWCISCKEEYITTDIGMCNECYHEASETKEELERGIEDLKAKLAFLRLCSPLDHTDVVLIASSNSTIPIPAHKAVLVNRSPVFKSILEKENENTITPEATIKIDDVSYATLRAFVNYLYTAETCFDDQLAFDVLVLVEKYEVKHLKTECEKFLVSKLNWDNSVISYAFRHKYNAKHLVEVALALILENMDKLTDREEYIELFERDPCLAVEIYEAYFVKCIKTGQ